MFTSPSPSDSPASTEPPRIVCNRLSDQVVAGHAENYLSGTLGRWIDAALILQLCDKLEKSQNRSFMN